MTNNQLNEKIDALEAKLDEKIKEYDNAIKGLKSKTTTIQNNVKINHEDLAEQINKCKDTHRTFGY